ncbi:MAG: aspartate-semialdehyde dehydrogenase [Clostridiales bacterium]|nr:aspartate-semialdehyde dehydrogenase [Clostridiales bacterium]
MKKYRAGIIGATGMVGQRFIKLLENHPYFEVTALSASARSAGHKYEDAVSGRWLMDGDIPEYAKKIMVHKANDIDAVKDKVDFVFCAVSLDKAATRELEYAYAKNEIPVVSSNSAHRKTPDVPMLIPEVNPEHLDVIQAQRTRLGTQRGFISVKPNCSLQTYVPALAPLTDFGITKILACTYQAISGAGKTFDMWPDMVDNVIPYIGGEEEKSEEEPLKIWGNVEDGEIKNVTSPDITSQCIRVPVTDGHMAAVFVSFENKPSIEEIKKRWKAFNPIPQQLGLPSAPKPFLTYFEDPSRPQTKMDRDIGNGMGVSMGRLREDSQYDYKFICLSHNTVRGAAGGGLLTAELLAKKGYFD